MLDSLVYNLLLLCFHCQEMSSNAMQSRFCIVMMFARCCCATIASSDARARRRAREITCVRDARAVMTLGVFFHFDLRSSP